MIIVLLLQMMGDESFMLRSGWETGTGYHIFSIFVVLLFIVFSWSRGA